MNLLGPLRPGRAVATGGGHGGAERPDLDPAITTGPGVRNTPTNTILTVLLREYGYTHRSPADEANRIPGRVFGRLGAATTGTCGVGSPATVRWPTGRSLLPLAESSDRPPRAMGFVPPDRFSRPCPASPAPVRARAGGTREAPRIPDRVHCAAPLSLMLCQEETPVRGRLTMADADRITTTVGRLDAHFTAIGGALLTRRPAPPGRRPAPPRHADPAARPRHSEQHSEQMSGPAQRSTRSGLPGLASGAESLGGGQLVRL